MKFKSMVLFLILFSAFFVESVFATKKVYPLDSYYGIVADDKDWVCSNVLYNGAHLFGSTNSILSSLYGKSQFSPIHFYFFSDSIQHYGIPKNQEALIKIKSFLSNYAQKTKTVFSGINIKSSEDGKFIVASGSYFDDKSSGVFSFYIKPVKREFYFFYYMFIKTLDNMLDEQTIEYHFQETFNLITPLVS